MSTGKQQSVVIVGGGLVGALNACYLARRGFKVDLYELRSDIRTQEVVVGRSINLALSKRGRDALKAVGLEDLVVSNGIPMYARMIHNKDGTKRPIPYGTKEQYIMSVDRRKLNELLLSAAEKYPDVTLHFEHKLQSCDFKNVEITMQNGNQDIVQKTSDLIIGCDGAFSAVRREVMKSTLFDYSQQYIPHGYLEFTIPPKGVNEFAMETNYLHIWPRNEFMMIALPDTQGYRFVVTLFMPFKIYDIITSEAELDKFFDDNFPDAVPLIGRDSIRKVFFKSKPLPLVSVKCQPYHLKNMCVMMGDAIHAMVPFYGQGMNCGFEDCLVFDELMEKNNNKLELVLEQFTDSRNADAKAMCDLAMYNYIEMRQSVNSRLFLLRKHMDNFLHWLMPNAWIPLYTSVSFTRIPYHQCIQNRAWQDKVILGVMSVIGVTGVGLLASGTYMGYRHGSSTTSLRDAVLNNHLMLKLTTAWQR